MHFMPTVFTSLPMLLRITLLITTLICLTCVISTKNRFKNVSNPFCGLANSLTLSVTVTLAEPSFTVLT